MNRMEGGGEPGAERNTSCVLPLWACPVVVALLLLAVGPVWCPGPAFCWYLPLGIWLQL